MAHDGKPRCYQRGCRLPQCTAANTRAVKLYRYRTNYGRVSLYVSALETRRYLEDLMLRGYSGAALASRLGIARKVLHAYREGKVTPETAAKVKTLWAELILLPAPTGQGATRARNYARKLGAIPVALYEDPSDPDEYPDERQAA